MLRVLNKLVSCTKQINLSNPFARLLLSVLAVFVTLPVQAQPTLTHQFRDWSSISQNPKLGGLYSNLMWHLAAKTPDNQLAIADVTFRALNQTVKSPCSPLPPPGPNAYSQFRKKNPRVQVLAAASEFEFDNIPGEIMPGDKRLTRVTFEVSTVTTGYTNVELWAPLACPIPLTFGSTSQETVSFAFTSQNSPGSTIVKSRVTLDAFRDSTTDQYTIYNTVIEQEPIVLNIGDLTFSSPGLQQEWNGVRSDLVDWVTAFRGDVVDNLIGEMELKLTEMLTKKLALLNDQKPFNYFEKYGTGELLAGSFDTLPFGTGALVLHENQDQKAEIDYPQQVPVVNAVVPNALTGSVVVPANIPEIDRSALTAQAAQGATFVNYGSKKDLFHLQLDTLVKLGSISPSNPLLTKQFQTDIYDFSLSTPQIRSGANITLSVANLGTTPAYAYDFDPEPEIGGNGQPINDGVLQIQVVGQLNVDGDSQQILMVYEIGMDATALRDRTNQFPSSELATEFFEDYSPNLDQITAYTLVAHSTLGDAQTRVLADTVFLPLLLGAPNQVSFQATKEKDLSLGQALQVAQAGLASPEGVTAIADNGIRIFWDVFGKPIPKSIRSIDAYGDGSRWIKHVDFFFQQETPDPEGNISSSFQQLYQGKGIFTISASPGVGGQVRLLFNDRAVSATSKRIQQAKVYEELFLAEPQAGGIAPANGVLHYVLSSDSEQVTAVAQGHEGESLNSFLQQICVPSIRISRATTGLLEAESYYSRDPSEVPYFRQVGAGIQIGFPAYEASIQPQSECEPGPTKPVRILEPHNNPGHQVKGINQMPGYGEPH